MHDLISAKTFAVSLIIWHKNTAINKRYFYAVRFGAYSNQDSKRLVLTTISDTTLSQVIRSHLYFYFIAC